MLEVIRPSLSACAATVVLSAQQYESTVHRVLHPTDIWYASTVIVPPPLACEQVSHRLDLCCVCHEDWVCAVSHRSCLRCVTWVGSVLCRAQLTDTQTLTALRPPQVYCALRSRIVDRVSELVVAPKPRGGASYTPRWRRSIVIFFCGTEQVGQNNETSEDRRAQG
jgi:hypothetical protein